MNDSRIFSFFHRSFKSVSRPQREQILCAMIRINYGTPWKGDAKILENFFPIWFHKSLIVGGLTQLIEALSPFTDEPTEHGFDKSASAGQGMPARALEATASINILTTDIPL
ncbi:hypothetical protein K1X76_04515 [bacterium]|nr:hypothetical protein [bacterium]